MRRVIPHSPVLSGKRSLALTALLFTIPSYVSTQAQALGWSSVAQSQPVTYVGGQASRQGVGAALFQGKMYLAYTSQSSSDQYGNGQVYLESSTDGINFTHPVAIVPPSPQGPLQGISNPSLSVWNNRLYIAVTANQGSGNYNQAISTADGINFSGIGSIDFSQTINSISVATFGSSLYAALERSDLTIDLCQFVPRTSSGVPGDYTTSCKNFPNNKSNFNPALGVFNGSLYIGYSNYLGSPSHDLILLYTSDGVNFTTSTAVAGDQSSTPPSFAVHKGQLYLGFRTNDGDHKFLYRGTTDGLNWGGDADPSYTIGGYPQLVDTTGFTTCSFGGAVIDYFSDNLGANTLYSTHLQ